MAAEGGALKCRGDGQGVFSRVGAPWETPSNETLDIERHEMKKPEMAVEKRENTDGDRWIGGE